MKKLNSCLFILSLVVILILSGCSSDTTQAQTTATVESTSNEEEVPTETQKVVYSINQDIDVDYITYKVTKIETFNEMGTSMFKKETEGKFVKVYLKLTNNAQETKDIFSPRFKIEDSKGRKYDRLSDDMMYISDYLEFGKQLQPGLGTSGAIVFELPTDSTDLHLLIAGDWISATEVKVLLSDINDIEKDTTQKDEQDAIMDEAMADSQEQMNELMNQCNAPFSCSSTCPDFMDVGQKDCSSGQVCCME